MFYYDVVVNGVKHRLCNTNEYSLDKMAVISKGIAKEQLITVLIDKYGFKRAPVHCVLDVDKQIIMKRL